MKRLLFTKLLFLALSTVHLAWADTASNWNKASDLSTASLAMLAGGLTLLNSDTDGAKQLIYSTVSSVGAAEILKNSVREQRPDKSDNKSFPSAHTTLAFSAAAFVDQRYGDSYGSLAPAMYGLAGLTGLARVQSKSHHFGDVLAGGVIGYGSSKFFTTPIQGGRVSLAPIPRGVAIAWVKPM